MKLHFNCSRIVSCGALGNSARSSPATQGKLAALAAYDATTGERRAYHDLGGLVEGGHFANDLALDAQGQVYVTECAQGQRLPAAEAVNAEVPGR